MRDRDGDRTHSFSGGSGVEEESGKGPESSARLVGDGYDLERLLTAAEVSDILNVPTKSVYGLPIKRIRLGKSRVRWRPSEVRKFIDARVEASA